MVKDYGQNLQLGLGCPKPSIATDINLHLEGEKPIPVSGVLFDKGRLVERVHSLGTWTRHLVSKLNEQIGMNLSLIL